MIQITQRKAIFRNIHKKGIYQPQKHGKNYEKSSQRNLRKYYELQEKKLKSQTKNVLRKYLFPRNHQIQRRRQKKDHFHPYFYKKIENEPDQKRPQEQFAQKNILESQDNKATLILEFILNFLYKKYQTLEKVLPIQKIQEPIQKLIQPVKEKRQDSRKKLSLQNSVLKQKQLCLKSSKFILKNNRFYIYKVAQSYLNPKPQLQEFRNHFEKLFSDLQTMKSLRLNQNMNSSYFEQQFSKKKSFSVKRCFQKILVFDLDETLIHSTFKRVDSDFTISIKNNGYYQKVLFLFQMSILVRPQIMKVLNVLKKYFDIVIFTAACKSYADAILEKLDPKKQIFSQRFYRHHCTKLSNGLYAKDISIISKDLKNIVLIDNSAFSFYSQISNGIPILSYFGNEKDNEFLDLKEYLLTLISVEDVRQSIKQWFQLKKITNFSQPKQFAYDIYS